MWKDKYDKWSKNKIDQLDLLFWHIYKELEELRIDHESNRKQVQLDLDIYSLFGVDPNP